MPASDQGCTFFGVSTHFFRDFFGHHRSNPEQTPKQPRTNLLFGAAEKAACFGLGHASDERFFLSQSFGSHSVAIHGAKPQIIDVKLTQIVFKNKTNLVFFFSKTIERQLWSISFSLRGTRIVMNESQNRRLPHYVPVNLHFDVVNYQKL